jgi:hypothetical protein
LVSRSLPGRPGGWGGLAGRCRRALPGPAPAYGAEHTHPEGEWT